MAEYIKRKDAIDLFWTVDTENNGDDGYTVVIKFGRCYDSNEIEALLSKLPAADVAEVRHGRWDASDRYKFLDGSTCIRCTECGAALHLEEYQKYHWHYCPNCGARMDEEDEHEVS